MWRVVVLGGGLSGLSAAREIARTTDAKVTVCERSATPGGLAGSFERAGHAYPLGYHHILPTDGTLLRFLDLIGAMPDVRWRKVALPFEVDGRRYDLSQPKDFARFPLRFDHKLRFAALMARAYRKTDWSDWQGRPARDLIDEWCGPQVREAIFEHLCRLKFELPTSEVSAAWMGARLNAREGSGKLGYIPGANWTTTLCDGVLRLCVDAGVDVRTSTRVTALDTLGGRVETVVLESGEALDADVVVSAMPTSVLGGLLPGRAASDRIAYTALLSLVGGTRQDIPDDFYWLSLLTPDSTASGIFLLSALNPTIGPSGERCLNFITHLRDKSRPLFALGEAELLARYLADYRRIFGIDLDLDWFHLSRIPQYSPVFVPDYCNPSIRSAEWSNLYLTGNYRTYPSVASTGTALQAGLDTAQAVLADLSVPLHPPAALRHRWWPQRGAVAS